MLSDIKHASSAYSMSIMGIFVNFDFALNLNMSKGSHISPNIQLNLIATAF